MSGWKTHLTAGVAAGGVAALALNGLGLQSLAAAVLGALLPDADHHKTKAFKAVLVVIGATAFALAKTAFPNTIEGVGISLAVGLAAAAIAAWLKPAHRGVTHSLAFCAAFALALWLLTHSPSTVASGGIAFATHLVLDRELKAF